MITTGNWQDALEPIARVSFRVGLKEIPAERDMLFSVESSDKLTETYLETGDIGSMEEFTGGLAYDDVAQGYKMTITAREFAKGIKIQRKFVRTDQLDIVKSLPKMLGLAARRRIATDVFYGYNNAFNTSITTLDALQLCSSAHTSNNGGSNQSNRGTSAFSAVSVEATRIAMKRYLTNTDQKFETMPDLLLVPTDLEEAAYELVNSSGKVDTANNNKNFHNGKYKVLATQWLDDTNNWFFIDSDLLKQFAVWNNVDPVDFGQADDFDGLVAKYRAYMFYGFGFRDWRFVYGQEVS
jgi:phage major head subunit gpT-like protein